MTNKRGKANLYWQDIVMSPAKRSGKRWIILNSVNLSLAITMGVKFQFRFVDAGNTLVLFPQRFFPPENMVVVLGKAVRLVPHVLQ